MKRVYGNSIVGEWSSEDCKFTIFPNTLKAREAEFEWLPGEVEGYLYPHKDGKPLIYDEAE